MSGNLLNSLCTILLAALCVGLVAGDVWPGDSKFYDICVEIIDDVNGNSIPFREFQNICKLKSPNSNRLGPRLSARGCSRLTERERLSRFQLCNRLVTQHNTHNSGFIGASVSLSACTTNALLNPLPYQAADWNQWAGKHCGTWYSSGGDVFPDNANWNNAGIQSGFHHQDVNFLGRTCSSCHDGWNESGGTEIVVWGWDPKDDTNHFGYQGAHVGYPFNSGGAKCIVWITGEEAFLECIKGGKRTSAGFWGYGHWNVIPLSSTC